MHGLTLTEKVVLATLLAFQVSHSEATWIASWPFNKAMKAGHTVADEASPEAFDRTPNNVSTLAANASPSFVPDANWASSPKIGHTFISYPYACNTSCV
jgi:hypothetical protein